MCGLSHKSAEWLQEQLGEALSIKPKEYGMFKGPISIESVDSICRDSADTQYILIMESVDSICRDGVDTQYMLTRI